MRKDTVQDLVVGWVYRAGINSFVNSFVMVNLFVCVWDDNTTVLQRAVVAIIMDVLGIFWSGAEESKGVRRFILTHYIPLLWCAAVIDILISPIYFRSAYLYFIVFLVVLDGAYGLMFSTLANEVRELLLSDANARNSYIARLAKVRCFSSVVAAITTMLLPISEWDECWMFCAIILCILVTSGVTTEMFRRTARYMKSNNLVFYCQR